VKIVNVLKMSPIIVIASAAKQTLESKT